MNAKTAGQRASEIQSATCLTLSKKAGSGSTVSLMRRMTCCAERFGNFARTRAAAAATHGVAMEVPLSE